MPTRLLTIGAVVALLICGWLSLMPFNDREVRCGAPLLGADPPANYSITPGTCSDMASDRLVLAAVFALLGIVLAVAAVIVAGTPNPSHQSGARETAHA